MTYGGTEYLHRHQTRVGKGLGGTGRQLTQQGPSLFQGGVCRVIRREGGQANAHGEPTFRLLACNATKRLDFLTPYSLSVRFPAQWVAKPELQHKVFHRIVIPYRLLQGLFARSTPYCVLNIEAPCHRRGLTLNLSAGRLLLHLTLEGAGPLSPLYISAGPWANNPTFSQSPDQGSTWPACQWIGLGCNLSVFTPLRPSCRVLYSNWTRNSHTLVSGAVASPPPF